MLVCVCNGVSDKQIDAALASGSSSFKEIKSDLDIGNCCGQCVPFAKDMVSDKISEIQATQTFHLAQEIHF
tara:strand:- start:2070 stop:2282 length:213 start_codon:yes stop_codon:yes gene_type:complete